MLRDFARTDWQLGGMCCQILWNFSARITSSNAMFGEAEAQELSDALVDLLGQCPFTSLPVHQFRNMLCLFQTKMTCLSTATTTRQCASSLCRCGGTTSGLLPSNFSTASKRTNQISRRSSRPRDEKPHAFVSRATFHRAGHVVLHRRSAMSDVTPSCFLFRSQSSSSSLHRRSRLHPSVSALVSALGFCRSSRVVCLRVFHGFLSLQYFSCCL